MQVSDTAEPVGESTGAGSAHEHQRDEVRGSSFGLDDAFVGGELRGHADELEGHEASGSGVHHSAVEDVRVDVGEVGALRECDQVLGVGSGTETKSVGESDGSEMGTVLNSTSGACDSSELSQGSVLPHACYSNLAGVPKSEFAPKSSASESGVEHTRADADDFASRQSRAAGGRQGRWVLRRRVVAGRDSGFTGDCVISRYVAAAAPRRGCHRGQEAYRRHRRDQGQRRRRRARTPLEDGRTAAAASPLPVAELTASDHVSREVPGLEDALANLPSGRVGAAARECVKSSRLGFCFIRWRPSWRSEPATPISALQEGRVLIYDARAAVVPALCQYRWLASEIAWTTGQDRERARFSAFLSFADFVAESRSEGSSFFSIGVSLHEATRVLELDEVWWHAVDRQRTWGAWSLTSHHDGCIASNASSRPRESPGSSVCELPGASYALPQVLDACKGARDAATGFATCGCSQVFGDDPPVGSVAPDGSVCVECSAPDLSASKSESAFASSEQFEAARVILAAWHAYKARAAAGDLKRAAEHFGWDDRRTRKVGDLVAHVRFLQHVLRAWGAGPRRGLGRVWRRRLHRCKGGQNLASEGEFVEQQQRAERMLLWYEQYVAIVRRARSGVTPMVLSTFCGGGGSSEGVKRSGGCSVGVDSEDQPDYKRRFGEQTFVQGDATSWALISSLCKRFDFVGIMGSPPCKWYSRARGSQPTKAPALIPLTRDVSRMFFDYWAIENVMGAAKHMSDSSAELFGQAFGCRVDRARKIEASFNVWIDDSVRRAGLKLRERTCLGERRRWRRLDEFGRPEGPCCKGNIFAVQGTAPWKCTAAECAEAMGIDRDHMTYERLGQALPPSYTRLVWAQMCMAYAHDRWGVPVISFDEKEADPAWANRTMARWLRGAGDARVDSGVSIEGALASGGAPMAEQSTPGEMSAAAPSAAPCSEEAAFREVFYSHVGGFDQQVASSQAAWLHKLGRCRDITEAQLDEEHLLGRNTFIRLSSQAAKRVAARVAAIVAPAGAGTRVSVQVAAKHEHWLRRLGSTCLSRTRKWATRET